MIIGHHALDGQVRQTSKPVAYSTARLQEVFIASACGFQLVGFPNARPLRRSPALDRDRYQRLRQILSVSEDAARKLRDYIISQGHHEPDNRRPKVVPASFSMPRSYSNDETAQMGAALLSMGLIGLRGSEAQEGVVLPMVFGGDLSLSRCGRLFLFHREVWRGHSEHLHWPGGASGVTIGPGYDMNGAADSKEQIISDLTAIGVDRAKATVAAEGFGKTLLKAKGFADDNKKLITLTDSQQEQLLRITIPKYEKNANQSLNDDVKQRLFAHEYDALMSFTYNHGSLGRTTLLCGAVNDGRLDDVSIKTGFNEYLPGVDAKRRPMEIRLFTRGMYV
ncbi:glycoside hydrolase family protein [Telmatospirillum sp.]|uniref:glycoside hydrolase family protein n=1 Tax=Telmatospirillum sp. TaxID=2079197 RepID=UPI002844AA0C|nr:hypothetical protein [Telmatospirillum sp.]MDR3440951.1 hypothetical protein [Telmatospirillum sp.]